MSREPAVTVERADVEDALKILGRIRHAINGTDGRLLGGLVDEIAYAARLEPHEQRALERLRDAVRA